MNASPIAANLELPEVSPNGLPTIKPVNGHSIHPPGQRSLSVLCVDDEEGIRELLMVCLSEFGHRVTVAACGMDGIKSFRAAQKSQPFDVVVTDMGMPDINGLMVARTIKAESPATPVVMLTGWGKSVRDDGDNISAVDVVVDKPPHIHELNGLLLRLTRPANPAN
jgi:CheY-like chemotaxis protein